MERRTFLVLGAAAVGVAGCTGQTSEPGPPSAPPGSVDPVEPDSRLRAEVAASEVALIAAYRSAIGASPALAGDLEPFLAHHEQHLARVAPEFEVGPGSPPPSAAAAAPAGSASPSASDSPSSAPPAADTNDALADLAARESEAQVQRESACEGVQDPALARDLCLIAASEAQHAALLAGLAARKSGS